MNLRKVAGRALMGAMVLAAAAGCSKKSIVNPKPNERPILELTRAPYNESTRFEYSYRMDWLGYDPDGRIAYYLYAIDPPHPTAINPDPDTAWVQTSQSERLVTFSATKPDSSQPGVNGSSDFHTFVVKAIDNGGLGGPLQSAPLVRAFFSYTVAPTVQILDPAPSDRARNYVTPSVRISWTGADDDGILDNKKPVKYKFILLTQNSPVPFQLAAGSDPDTVRRYYVARNWAGWDSTSADTTEHQYTNLVVGQDYMFCLIGFDEAGAYSPVFSQNSNMLNMRVTFAATGGPLFTVFNDFFFYQYKSATYSTLPQYVINIEVPAGEPIPFTWTAVANPGASVRGYRWALDIDNLDDPTPRTDERTDLKHWSIESPANQISIGPFGGGETHRLYIEGVDNNNLKSLAIVQFFVVQADLSRELLVVNDTRLKVDGTSICTNGPVSRWPMSAELDTFLYARGGFQYKCNATGVMSSPGVFKGYPFDTMGTRTGQSEVRVPLATLGHYRHVIWMTDGTYGGINNSPGTNIGASVSALRYMCDRGHANSIAAYLRQGGQVWLLGGGIVTASMMPYDVTGNNTTPPAAGITFSYKQIGASPAELQAGRFVYDVSHWQSEIKVTSTTFNAPFRYLGRFDSTGVIPPGYANLPTRMRFKNAALGDTLWPRRNSSDFYNSVAVDLEYLSQPNYIVEDIDPSPLVDNEQSTLDTLYYATGSALEPPSFNKNNVCMTVYHGPAYTYPIIMSGINIWNWTKSDCIAIVNSVVHDIWGINRSVPASSLARPRASAAATKSSAATASIPVPEAARMPVIHFGRAPDR